jgi:hypothetical protein
MFQVFLATEARRFELPQQRRKVVKDKHVKNKKWCTG